MKYEKPSAIAQTEMAEGVYTHSGTRYGCLSGKRMVTGRMKNFYIPSNSFLSVPE